MITVSRILFWLSHRPQVEILAMPYSSSAVKETTFNCHQTTFTSKYLDVGPKDGVTCLCTHGAPGHHDHFADLAVNLSDKGMRVIALNWPGYDNTKCDSLGSYGFTPADRLQYMQAFAKSLGLNKIDILLGHSFSCVTVHHVAAHSDFAKSYISLNPVCHRPHKGLRPLWKMGVSSRLLNSPLRPFLRLMLPLGWKLAGFEPESTDTYEAATHETGQMNKDVAKIVAKDIPRLIAYCKTDRLIQSEISREYVDLLGITDGQFLITDDNGVSTTEVTRESGRFARAIQFARGGHFAQRNDSLLQHIMDLADFIQTQK